MSHSGKRLNDTWLGLLMSTPHTGGKAGEGGGEKRNEQLGQQDVSAMQVNKRNPCTGAQLLSCTAGSSNQAGREGELLKQTPNNAIGARVLDRQRDSDKLGS